MTTAKLRPCKEGARHRWAFLRNVWIGHAHVGRRGTTVHQKKRGLYACACGERRYGAIGDAPAVTPEA